MIILKQNHENKKVKAIKSNLLKYDKKSDQILF